MGAPEDVEALVIILTPSGVGSRWADREGSTLPCTARDGFLFVRDFVLYVIFMFYLLFWFLPSTMY